LSTANEEISTEGESADGAWYDARRERAVKKRGERSGGKKARGGAGSAEAITAALLEIMEQSRLLRRGDRVAVAVSGGADSVALLLLLVELRQKLELTLHILHFNHKLRGRAAEADEKFVVKLAEEYRLPYWHGSAEVKSLAKRDKANLEDAARRARYAFFAQATGEHELDKIAVAHTADDQAETVLGHILRGSGLTGLGGIHPQVGKVVRPLLGARREELRAFLKSRKQNWREDATNRDVAKFRARIRKNLLPLLQKEFQPRVVEHLAALAAHAREDDALLNRLAEERLKNKLEIVAEGARMRVADLLANDLFRDEDAFTALSSRLIRRIIRKHKSMHTSAGAGELTAMHVGQVLELARRGNNGATLQLPGGIEVRRHADALVFCAATKKKATALREEHQYEHEIDFLLGSTLLQVPELGCAFRFTVIDWLAKRAETSVSGDVLNRDALRFPLTLRNWRHGDRFRAVGHSKPQKLKRLFNEQGIDRWRRGGWPVIVSDGILAWARGFGASAEFAVDDGTHTGIVIAEEQSA
jgi:tRNA(Ile)-lysidine synthase